MRITLFAHGLRGDVWPLVALGWHLARRDHDVTVAVPEEFREFTEGAGLRTAPLPFDMVAWLRTTNGQQLLRAGGIAILRGMGAEYTRHAVAFDEAFEAATQGAEAIIATTLTMDRAQVVGDLRQIPVANLYPQPIGMSSQYGSTVMTKGNVRSRVLCRGSHELAERLWWQGNAKATRAFRRKLGLPECSRSTYRRLQYPGALGLHTISPSLFPRPTDWGSHLTLTGAWAMPAAVRGGLGEELPDELQAWLDAGDPPIFLGFGSMPVLDPQPLLDDIISVTNALGRRAVLGANCVPAHARDSLPDHLRVVNAVDHDRLFPQCAVVVHHGGLGSTIASTRSGRPTMVCSVFGDQPWWGEHMRRLGVGTHMPFRKLDRDALKSGLQVLFEPAVAARARALGAAIRAEGDGLPEATQLLEDWLVTAEPTPMPALRRSSRIARSPDALRAIADLPGPPRLPLIGNAHQLTRGSRIHLTSEKWARRYGPIVRVDIGPRRILLISDADAINEILRERPDGYRRWTDQQAIIEEMGVTGGVLAAEGADWKRQRRLVVTALNINKLQRYFEVIQTSGIRLHRRLEQAAQGRLALNITDELTSYTVDITSGLAFGHDLNTLEQRHNELQGHIQRMLTMTSRRLGSPMPYWRWVRLPADRALDRSVAQMQRAVDAFIEQGRARMVARPELYEDPENLLEAMLAAQASDGTFTHDDIVGNAFTLLLAGEDTTAHTLGWTVWLLASRPDIQARLALEAREALGDHPFPPDYQTVEQLTYAEAVLRESMRLRPVSPVLPMEPLADVTICDTHIPAGTRLLLLLRAAGLHEGPGAGDFRPERWLTDDDPPPKSLAFGAGPRFCPGRNLAFAEVKSALAMITRDFEITLDPSVRPVRESLNFAMVPQGLRVLLTRREPAESVRGLALAPDGQPV
jgi:cytochrome P450/UDP:flavonoid glycosyltransferase YjiC (YdhE family)